MRALEFIRDHVTFKLPYDFSYQMKTPQVQQSQQQALRTHCLDIYRLYLKVTVTTMMNVKAILNVENTIALKWIQVQNSQLELIVAMILIQIHTR